MCYDVRLCVAVLFEFALCMLLTIYNVSTTVILLSMLTIVGVIVTLLVDIAMQPRTLLQPSFAVSVCSYTIHDILGTICSVIASIINLHQHIINAASKHNDMVSIWYLVHYWHHQLYVLWIVV